MSKIIDLTGKKFGKLTVIRQYEEKSKNNKIQWMCVCECTPNKEIIKIGSYLRNGDSKSCGCIRKELLIKRNKILLPSINKKYNNYEFNDECYVLCIDDKKYYFDTDDFERIQKYWWVNERDGYARTFSNEYARRGCSLHRLIMNVEDKEIEVDHIDRNKKNNRKNNLRLSTNRENSLNRTIASNNNSGIIGVFWVKRNNKWRVTISNKVAKCGYYGQFDSFDEAVKVRLTAEKQFYGEYAPQRHLFSTYNIK